MQRTVTTCDICGVDVQPPGTTSTQFLVLPEQLVADVCGTCSYKVSLDELRHRMLVKPSRPLVPRSMP